MCHSSTRPGTSYHVTQFYQAFPRVSTASDKRWGEKAWVRGYIFSTSQDHPAGDTHHSLPTATQPSSYSVHPWIILGWSSPSKYCYSKFGTGQHTNSRGSLVTDPGINSGLAYYMSEYWPALVTGPEIIPGLAYMSEYTGQHTYSRGSLVTGQGIIPGLAYMSEYTGQHTNYLVTDSGDTQHPPSWHYSKFILNNLYLLSGIPSSHTLMFLGCSHL